jgi:preprotein translocase SecE subunit
MARQTRQQRRARREGQVETAPAAARPRPRPVTAPAAEEAPRHDARSPLPGFRFLQECWAELKKVEWPGQQQLVAGTTVVLVACIIVGFYLYVNDIVWHRVVQDILLK